MSNHRRPSAPPAADAAITYVQAPAFCLDCRTVLARDERCDGGVRHRVIVPARAPDCEQLANEVWGPPSVRQKARQLARAGGTGAAAGSLSQVFDGCSACDGADLFSGDLGGVVLGILVVLAVALVAVVLVYLLYRLVYATRVWLAKPRARGAIAAPPAPGGTPSAVGVVTAAGSLDAPWSRAPCAAYALELRQSHLSSDAVMLRRAQTAGFELALADGTRVRVPAGRIRLEAAWHTRELEEMAPASIAELSLNSTHVDELEVLPCDRAVSAELNVGDRVELYAPLHPELDDQAPAGSYRAAGTVLVATGVPTVRVVS